jgi:Uma2 family endonuclease
MSTAISSIQEVEIPTDIHNLADFRRWCHSDSFPERGRIDFLKGIIEVDMSPEDLFAHARPKVSITHALESIILEDDEPGLLCSDRMRVVSEPACLSVEPDLVYVAYESLHAARVQLVPKSGGPADRYVEFSGAVDLVVEIVSDGSTDKDLRRLPAAYFEAGVREYWIVDARKNLRFTIQQRGSAGYEAATSDCEGFQPSLVLNRRFRFRRERNRHWHWSYFLDVQPITG